MNFKVLVFLGISLCVSVTNLFSQEKAGNQLLVSTVFELKAAIASAKPGQSIVMKDGIWKNAVIDFNSTATESQPITLCAQTPGKVILKGNSTLTFSKPNLIVDGLVFKNGKIDKGSVINLNSDNCRLTNTAIINYNPDDFKIGYYWVYFQGNHNRMDHCYLTGKSNMNPVVQNFEENARYNKVDSCLVKDIPYVKHANGREIFRIFGYGHADQTGNDGAYFTVEYNLFDHAHGEGTEIVSLKSNYNIVRFNTVIASKGGLVGRRGKNNTFEGNIVLGQEMEGSTGIRVAGSNHMVINNYVADVAEDGLRLITGEYFEKSLTSHFAAKKKDLPKYLQVKNGYFAQNTIVNCGGHGIDIGYNYESHWPDLQMILLPENNRFVNNLVSNCKGNSINAAVQDKNKPLDIFSFKPNYFQGNVVWGSPVSITPIPAGIQSVNPKLTFGKDGFYRPESDSPASENGALPPTKTENLSSLQKNLHALSANEVGPRWMMKN